MSAIFSCIGLVFNKIKFRNTVDYKISEKNGTTFRCHPGTIMYKLSFLLHSLLDNGARMTPKRRSVFSLIFIVIGWVILLNTAYSSLTEYQVIFPKIELIAE